MHRVAVEVVGIQRFIILAHREIAGRTPRLDIAEPQRPAPISILLTSFMPRKLSDEEIEAFLDSRPSWAILSTIDTDGFPHTVPLGYFRLGRDIIMGIRDGTRKVANIESNPNVSVLLEDGSSMADIRGVMFQGHARIVREPNEALQLAREGARRRGVPEPEWPTAPRPGSTYIRVTPVSTVSWDYAESTPDHA